MLGLGNNLLKVGLVTPGVVTSNLVLKHNYSAGGVVPVSDGAVYFQQANDDNISITETTLTTSGNCSIMFWYKHAAGSTAWAVLGHTSETNEKHLRFLNSDGKLKLESNTGNDIASITLNSSYSDNQWHHYAVICTSATITAYQDGVSLAVSNPGMSDDTTINLIGAQGSDGDSYNLDGYLCNLGTWTAALTQAQIKSIMWKKYGDLTDSDKDAGATGNSNLVSWWNLSADANDSTGTNNGTLTD